MRDGDEYDDFLEDIEEAVREARSEEMLLRSMGDDMGAARARMRYHRLREERDRMKKASDAVMLREFVVELQHIRSNRLNRTWKNLHKKARGLK
jgi:hypothetical protein